MGVGLPQVSAFQQSKTFTTFQELLVVFETSRLVGKGGPILEWAT